MHPALGTSTINRSLSRRSWEPRHREDILLKSNNTIAYLQQFPYERAVGNVGLVFEKIVSIDGVSV